jgi:hypothetical protein
MTDPLALAQQEASAQFATAVEWSALLQSFTISTDEQQEQVAGVLRDVKARYRAIEERRKEITGPLNAALKSVNDLFRPPREKFEALERVLKSKITAYLDQKARANTAALQAASVASTPEQAQQSLATVAPVAPPEGVSVRHVWKFEVTDPDAVPRQYCSPDGKKIGAVDPTTTAIPGVRFFQEPVVSSRRV